MPAVGFVSHSVRNFSKDDFQPLDEEDAILIIIVGWRIIVSMFLRASKTCVRVCTSAYLKQCSYD